MEQEASAKGRRPGADVWTQWTGLEAHFLPSGVSKQSTNQEQI
jgi:hypothetical protein